MDTLMPALPGARVLDLFAGAGAVGFEALSRGAASATFVERDARAAAALQQNVTALGLRTRARFVRADVLRALNGLATAGDRFDIVFLDPPYESDLVGLTLQRLGTGTVTAPDATVIAQHFTKQAPPEVVGALVQFRTRRFGETTLSFYRHREPSGAS
jgi:16S rRNA (guanine966-N2)-methyltransferase